MKIKIIKCKNENYWYNKHIGETFDVFITNDIYYQVVADQLYYHDYRLYQNDCILYNFREEKLNRILNAEHISPTTT